MMLIIITGMPGSGKEEVVKILNRSGLPIFRMGDVVREHAAKSNVDMTDIGVGGYASSQREEHGKDVWAARTLELIRKNGGEGDDASLDVVIDGSRSLFEITHFREHFKGDVYTIAVHTSPKIRFDRLKGRNRSDAPTSFEDFQVRDERELGWGLGSLIATADHLVVNEGSLDEYRSEIRHLVGKILM